MPNPNLLNLNEVPYPENFFPVDGIPPVAETLIAYGDQVVQRMHDIRNTYGQYPQILGLLNGSALILAAIADGWIQYGGDIDEITGLMRFASTTRDGSQKLWTPKHQVIDSPIVILGDDVVDDGNAIQDVEDDFQNSEIEIEVWTPMDKHHTVEALQKKRVQSKVYAMNTVADEWVVGGGGLDAGSAKYEELSLNERVELAFAQRLCGEYVYQQDGTDNPPFAKQLDFFRNRRLKNIHPNQPFFALMKQLEFAKLHKDYQQMEGIVRLLPLAIGQFVQQYPFKA